MWPGCQECLIRPRRPHWKPDLRPCRPEARRPVNLDLPVLDAASDLPARFYEKPRPDNQTAPEAITYDRALGLHLTFARTGTAENAFLTFNPTAVDNPLYDECAARFQFTR